MKSLFRRPSYWVMGAWTLIGIYWRVRTYAARSFWVDEGEQIALLTTSFAGVCGYLRRIPGGFPGDYLLTWPFIGWTTNKWIMTLPHIGTMLLSFYFLFLICRFEMHMFWGPFVTFGLFASNHNLIFHALEIRPYAALPALSLMIYWYSRQSVQRQTWNSFQETTWGLLWFVVLVFHAYGLFMAVFLLSYHLIFSRQGTSLVDTVKKLLIPTVVASVLAFPVWLYFMAPSAQNTYSYDVFQFSGHSAKAFLACVFGNLGDAGVRWLWILPFLIIMVSFALFDAHWKSRIGFFLLAIACPLVLIFYGDWRTHYWFLQRQFVWIMPLWALLAGHALESIIDRCSRISLKDIQA